MLAIVLISVLVQHLVTFCEAQKTIDDNSYDLFREDVDELYKCRENLAAITSNVTDAKDTLKGKDDCRKDVSFEGK